MTELAIPITHDHCKPLLAAISDEITKLVPSRTHRGVTLTMNKGQVVELIPFGGDEFRVFVTYKGPRADKGIVSIDDVVPFKAMVHVG